MQVSMSYVCVAAAAVSVNGLFSNLKNFKEKNWFWFHKKVYETIHCITLVSLPPVDMRRVSSCMNFTAVTWLLWPPYVCDRLCNGIKWQKQFRKPQLHKSAEKSKNRKKWTHFWLRCWIQKQFNFAKIISTSQQWSFSISTHCIDIRAIGILWPTANRLKRQATILCGPFNIKGLLCRCDLSA